MFNKGALALLNEYGSDSSDDDVPGPRVSTKRSFKDDDDNSYSHKKRLPLPKELAESNKKIEHTDDPTLHDGRLRSFAHERGNWATFVYIPYEAQIGISHLLLFLQEILPEHITLKQSNDFHISLTKTVILKYHWIGSFVETLKKNLSNFRKFMILFDKIHVYCNEERTRTFLGIKIRSGHDTLIEMVQVLDQCLEEYKLPPFYRDPSFHISIAWCVGDFENELQTYLPQINSKFQNLMENSPQENWFILAEYLLCKSGNKYFQFMLV